MSAALQEGRVVAVIVESDWAQPEKIEERRNLVKCGGVWELAERHGGVA